MAAGALYGLFLAVVTVVLTTVLPAALGWTILWAALSLQLIIGAAVVWRRTALPAMTFAFAWGGAAASVFAVMCARGQLFEDLYSRAPITLTIVVFLGPLVMFSEKWLHRAKWQALKLMSDEATFLDVLAFRHIPDLRVTDGTNG
jgi:hypothetical protein